MANFVYGAGIAAIFMGIALLIALASYVVYSIALMMMAKKCNIAAPALAWFPFTRSYLFGKVAERGSARNTPEPKPFRKKLLGFEITYSVCFFLMGIFYAIATMLALTYSYSYYFGSHSYYDYSTPESMLILVLLVAPLAIVGAVFAIIYTVNYFIAMWQVYRLFFRKAALPFLLVSIFVSGSAPVFMMIAACRTPDFSPDPDAEMPPQTPPQAPPVYAQPTYAPQQAYQQNYQQPYAGQPYAGQSYGAQPTYAPQQPYVQQPYVQQPYQQQPYARQPYQQTYVQQPYTPVQPAPTPAPAPAPAPAQPIPEPPAAPVDETQILGQ